MSADNRPRSKPLLEPEHAEPPGDARKIKKERADAEADETDAAPAPAPAPAPATVNGADDATRDRSAPLEVHRFRNPRPSQTGAQVSNGFHGGANLLQDVLSSKFAGLAHHGPAAKHDKIRLMIEDSIGEESKCRVQDIFSQVEQLKTEEKLLLYLKLPLSLTNPGGSVDPLRLPLNPLGNRYEIHQTIMWIKTHLEEDPDVSLPKQEVYDEYNMFCIRNSMKPLSTADFGKVMKQVYPRVRPRRLGTRGNSRYCYAGMRKRIKLDPPTLPSVTGVPAGDEEEENLTEEMLGAASTLIQIPALAVTPTPVKSGKLREAQLQLQRKLQQREHIRDQKHRHLDTVLQNQNKEKTVDNNKGGVGSKGGKRSKASQSPQGANPSSGGLAPSKQNQSIQPAGRQRKVLKPSASQSSDPTVVSLQSNCDSLSVQSFDESRSNGEAVLVLASDITSPKAAKSRNPRKRGNPATGQHPSESSPEKQAKLAEAGKSSATTSSSLAKLASTQRPGKVSVILASSLKPARCKASADRGEPKDCDIESSTRTVDNKANGTQGLAEASAEASVRVKSQAGLVQEEAAGTERNEKLCAIDPDSLDDYLNGGNNSQEQEEELLQYFQQSNSSGSDVEANIIAETERISRSDKVSQLRLILQQNLKAGVAHVPMELNSGAAGAAARIVSTEKRDPASKHNLILPTLLNHLSHTSTRRRVSFETNVVEHIQDSGNTPNTVPQSPNTRRKIFNFTPISPGPHSPINGRASKPNSANASPFVSPRNTPVPRSRSNIQSSSRSRSTQKNLSRSTSCGVPYTARTETFVVPTTGPELTRQMSAPQSPLTCIRSTEVQAPVVAVAQQVTTPVSKERGAPQPASFLPSDLAPQKQLVINYPSQENLQEIKTAYRKSQPLDQEISELFHDGKQYTNEQLYYRSQSVPLHRMVNPNLMSPVSAHQYHLPSFQSQSFDPSASSSIAPTPVPSEFNDFVGPIGQADNGSTYLLDEVDPNFISDSQQFLIGDKEITSENISNLLNILDEEGTQNLQILPDNTGEEALIESNPIVLEDLPTSNLNIQIIQSRSYPNTPLPPALSSYPPNYTEDSNGSRSYPSTPLHTVQLRETYPETNEPMLSSPTLNSLNLRSETVAPNGSNGVCRNVCAELLETDFLATDTNTETDDLDPLGNFDGLQDPLAPLFNEVTEPNP
ncbi:uncharacterized protein LOC105696267 isoform X2 [Orussus abietinus]|uniref:uncharacterized protein LOC105696267 isoform X2 n=1 Tax=Orussus abietinus TaxID=222816 RepID=UPI000626B86F|nr:uncharacterized protein LOC105696267 isoform X2 [Orussus abietinus]